jgi:hypothetical protein
MGGATRLALVALLTAMIACAAPTATPAVQPAGAGQPKLADLVAASKVAVFKITYHISATGSQPGQDAAIGDQTWYFKPPRARLDFVSLYGGPGAWASVFDLPEGTFLCSDQAGQTQCMAGLSTPLDQNMVAVARRDLLSDPARYDATFKETKKIAGQDGLCYEVTPKASSMFTTGNFCFTKDGISLLTSATMYGVTYSMEATSFSTTVPDSDFTLPAKPINP